MTINTCPPNHKHADTQTCYSLHKCRCQECKRQNSEYSYWRKRMIRHGRGPIKSIDATGTRRRIEALMSLGWSAGYLAGRFGTTYQAVNQYRTQERVTPETAKKVARLYDELWNARPNPATMPERVAVSRTLSFAKARGFLPPLAWDDIDHDIAPPEPDDADFIDEMAVAAAIDGLKPNLTYRERVQVVRILNREGLSDGEIAPYVGIVRESVYRLRKSEGIAAAPTIFRAA